MAKHHRLNHAYILLIQFEAVFGFSIKTFALRIYGEALQKASMIQYLTAVLFIYSPGLHYSTINLGLSLFIHSRLYVLYIYTNSIRACGIESLEIAMGKCANLNKDRQT
jgi:hypothetical protein